MGEWQAKLEKELCVYYEPSWATPEYETTPPERLIELSEEIDFLEFDKGEFAAAAWLYNLEHSFLMRNRIREAADRWISDHGREARNDPLLTAYGDVDFEFFTRLRGRELVVREFLENSPFDEGATERIVSAVIDFDESDDEPWDSSLLVALRVAVKLTLPT